MNRRLLILWAASQVLTFGCLAISLFTEFHIYRWQWGTKSYMEGTEHTRELILSHGELQFRCAADWSTPPPAPCWRETDHVDYDVDLGVFEIYRLREIWYYGEPPAGGLSPQQRSELPHFNYGRYGWNIRFMTAALVFLVPMFVVTLIALRVILRARRAKGLCRNCGYDLRGTPDRCPECGLIAEPANGNGSPA